MALELCFFVLFPFSHEHKLGCIINFLSFWQAVTVYIYLYIYLLWNCIINFCQELRFLSLCKDIYSDVWCVHAWVAEVFAVCDVILSSQLAVAKDTRLITLRLLLQNWLFPCLWCSLVILSVWNCVYGRTKYKPFVSTISFLLRISIFFPFKN